MDGAIVGPGDATGWWFQPTPLENDGVNVTWDDDIPKMMGKLKKMFQTTNQVRFWMNQTLAVSKSL